MNIRYKIFKEDGLLVQKFYGDWSNIDFESHLKKITKEPNWNYVKKTLTDIREGNIEPVLRNIETIAKVRNEIMKKTHFNVLLVDNPISTVAVHLYIEEFVNKYNYEYCSSIDYAIEKLELMMTCKQMEDVLKYL